MPYEEGKTYAFAYKAVQEQAPSASGVYTLYTSRRWVYVGETDDIQQSLFRHLNEQNSASEQHPDMDRFGPLSFSFETSPAADRVALQQGLIAELKPACNSASV